VLECLILGDSIGVGISQVRKECQAYVQSGINSENYVNRYGPVNIYNKHTIISLGTNDTKVTPTFNSLLKLRMGIRSKCVTWILPNKDIKPEQYEFVRQVAGIYRDTTISPRKSDLSKDKIHPTYKGYKSLASDADEEICS
jgi:hypothetical protein